LHSQRTIIGGQADACPHLFKFLTELTDIISCLSTKKDMQGLVLRMPSIGLLHQKKEWRNANTASDQTTDFIGVQGKAFPKWTEQITAFSRLEVGQQFGSLADNLDQQMKGPVTETTVDGKRTAQERIKGGATGCHDKLSGLCLRCYARRFKDQSEIGFREALTGDNNGFFLELRHGKRYKE
jgi:hypothetical protein